MKFDQFVCQLYEDKKQYSKNDVLNLLKKYVQELKPGWQGISTDMWFKEYVQQDEFTEDEAKEILMNYSQFLHGKNWLNYSTQLWFNKHK